jgi:CheY-like chemotaxis protein
MTGVPIADAERAEFEQMKGTFLSSLNHEIRTPLSGILGMTDLLLETNLDTEQKEYVQAARLCAENLFHVLNSTLEYSALQAGQLKLEETEFSLREMLDSLVGQEREKAEAKGLRLLSSLEPSLPETVIGDAARIRDILLHLLDNAIKFTSQGNVTLTLSSDYDQLIASVRDTGIGIPADRQAHIFESFRQGEMGLSRSYPGLGLGLALARKLASMMGGAIEFESQLDVGSTFRLRIPLRQPETQPQAQTAHSPRILAVEDNPVGQMVLRHSLKGRPIELDVTGSGQEALQAATTYSYDLILMDLQMPVMDGFAATAAIRKLPGYRNIPILALTANYSDAVRQQCQEFGMQGFLSKPVQSTELWSAISQNLS